MTKEEKYIKWMRAAATSTYKAKELRIKPYEYSLYECVTVVSPYGNSEGFITEIDWQHGISVYIPEEEASHTSEWWELERRKPTDDDLSRIIKMKQIGMAVCATCKTHFEDQKYSPCCSLNCWHKRFEAQTD